MAENKAREWLAKVDLGDKLEDFPDALSGGQKQRVAIARTLATDPEIILFDEVTASLDPVLVAEILRVIKRLAKDGRTMLVVTHHLKLAREISDRVIYFQEGEIIEEGLAEAVFTHPKREQTKRYL